MARHCCAKRAYSALQPDSVQTRSACRACVGRILVQASKRIHPLSVFEGKDASVSLCRFEVRFPLVAGEMDSP